MAISILSFTIATAAIVWIVARLSGSWLAGVAGALVFALNPNVLYLQSTPMTEPLLIALNVASIALLLAYCDAVVLRGADPDDRRMQPSAALVGWILRARVHDALRSVARRHRIARCRHLGALAARHAAPRGGARHRRHRHLSRCRDRGVHGSSARLSWAPGSRAASSLPRTRRKDSRSKRSARSSGGSMN
ncbi:MAG: hypothetical protein QM736_27455 [Vicinamibacterales bacterium]